MLTKRTVFVLGAGANVPYGFSTGARLLDRARMEDPQALMGNAGEQITRAQSEQFKLALIDNLLPSIDELLEYRTDLVRVGKRVMATLLYREEVAAQPGSSGADWVALIFRYMADGAATVEQFANNPVSFVTFNYDRYLEHRLIRGLVARYRVEPHVAWTALAGKIIHLHGSLGNLPEQFPLGTPERQQAVPLGAVESQDRYYLGTALAVAEQEIKIVHDTDLRTEIFTEAQQRFLAAERVLFFGFAFGRKNVERLQPVRIPDGVIVQCTTLGMTAAEVQDAVFPAFPNRDMTYQTAPTEIVQFLRDRIQYLR